MLILFIIPVFFEHGVTTLLRLKTRDFNHLRMGMNYSQQHITSVCPCLLLRCCSFLSGLSDADLHPAYRDVTRQQKFFQTYSDYAIRLVRYNIF